MGYIPPDVGYALIVTGLMEFVIARVVFAPKQRETMQNIKPGMSPEARRPFEEKLKVLNFILKSLTFLGIFLLVAGGLIAFQ